MKRKLHCPENYWSDNRCFSVYAYNEAYIHVMNIFTECFMKTIAICCLTIGFSFSAYNFTTYFLNQNVVRVNLNAVMILFTETLINPYFYTF